MILMILIAFCSNGWSPSHSYHIGFKVEESMGFGNMQLELCS